MVESDRFILIQDAQGYTLDGTVKSTFKKVIGDVPYSPVNVLQGELVEKFDYGLKLCRDPTILLSCCDDVAPLSSQEEFMLMEAIENPGERFEAFHGNQIELGLNLTQGCKVYVAVLGHRYARAIIHYKGKVGNLPGTMFGVEILEDACRLGTSDGTFQEKHYFSCRDGYGLFVPLSKLDQHQPASSYPSYEYGKKNSQGGQTHSFMNVHHKESYAQNSRSKSVSAATFRTTKIGSTTKDISTQDDDAFPSIDNFCFEDDGEHFQEENLEQIHQIIEQSQEELFTTLKNKLTNLQGELQQELKNICENQETKIQSRDSEIKRLSCIIQSKDIVVQEMKEAIGKRDIELEEMSSILRDKEVETMKMAEELQSNGLELQQMATKIKDLQQQLDSDESLLQLTGLQDSVAPWKIDRSEITAIPKKQIGCGAWGVVYSAHFKGEPVAIKIAHPEVVLCVEGTVDMIKREISIMAHIQHPNLVRFIGAVLDKCVETKMDTPIIVLELLDMDLRVAYGRERLERNTMSSIFCDVAYALHYLHDQREAIIHRDISAPNILLKRLPNGLFKAKVSDLGSANLVKDSRTAGAGALIYTAPEMFPQDISSAPPPQTTKVDVFSYGILLLEVVSKAIPTIDKRHSLLRTLKAKWESIYDLIVCCTQQSPSDRPTMRVILNILNRMEHN